MKTMQQTKEIWLCWLTNLENFQYDETHRAGKLITHADGLSRSDHLPDPKSYELEVQAEYIPEMDYEPVANKNKQMDDGLDTERLLRVKIADE